MNKYSKKIKEKNKYREFLKVLNGNLHLSDREIDILALLVQIDKEWRPLFEGDYKNVNSTDNRRSVMKESRVNKNNLTRFIRKFKSTGILSENEEGGLEVAPFLIPKEVGKIIEVVFTLDFGSN